MLKTIIDQNNRTLQLLQTQDFVNAIESSVLALRYCRQSVDMDGGTRCLKECLDHSMMMLLQDPPPSSPAVANNQHDSDGSGANFVYQQGIQIPRATIDLTMVTPVLVFNAALALQLLAAEKEKNENATRTGGGADITDTTGAPYYLNSSTTSSSSSSIQKLLLKAKRLYQLAHVQVDANTNTLFDFAVINNIAVIDQRLGNLLVSQSCFCYLEARYLILMHQRSTERLSHLEGFWGNHHLSRKTVHRMNK